jgi:hypothetical protein
MRSQAFLQKGPLRELYWDACVYNPTAWLTQVVFVAHRRVILRLMCTSALQWKGSGRSLRLFHSRFKTMIQR